MATAHPSQHHFHRHRPAPGSSPGSFSPPPEALPPSLRCIRYDQEHLEEFPLDPDADLARLESPERVTWLDVKGLGDAGLIGRLGEAFGLHRLVVADIANTGQRPKVEDHENCLYLVLRMASLGPQGVEWEQVSLVQGPRSVLTIQETERDCLEPLRERLRRGQATLRRAGADYLACMVADTIVDGYFTALEHYGERLEAIEDQILLRPMCAHMGGLYELKRELLAFRRAVWPLREALSSLVREGHTLVGRETVAYWRDVADHAVQVAEMVETFREMAASLVDLHLSSLGQRTNDVMRVLTVIATIFIPLTFLAGVYGMNFDRSSPANMPELGWRYGYPAFWAISLVLAGAMLILFRRLGWLGGRKDAT